MGTPFPVSIVIADDHPAVREGVTSLLRLHSDFNVVAACGDGKAAMEAIRAFAPDLAILDVLMPGLTGIDVLSSISVEGHKTKVIFFAATINDRQVQEAIAYRADGIILKDAEPDDLVKCIRDVVAGKRYFPQNLVEATFERGLKPKTESERLIDALTVR